jgi:hypothetical protein
MKDVWVFNPRGWNRTTILGDASHYYIGKSAGQILPERYGYDLTTDVPESFVEKPKKQSFEDFRLSDAEGPDGITIEKALELGWECTGVEGNWCRKPFLPRYVKAPEIVILCFEYATGTEIYQEEIVDKFGNIRYGPSVNIPRRPRACTMDETKVILVLKGVLYAVLIFRNAMDLI